MQINHSKYKNTGILFELLIRQITNDTLDSKDSQATNILKKYFVKTELGREYKLYETLLKKLNSLVGVIESIDVVLTPKFPTIGPLIVVLQPVAPIWISAVLFVAVPIANVPVVKLLKIFTVSDGLEAKIDLLVLIIMFPSQLKGPFIIVDAFADPKRTNPDVLFWPINIAFPVCPSPI